MREVSNFNFLLTLFSRFCRRLRWFRVPSLACKFTGVLCSAGAGFDLKTIEKICIGFLWSGPDMVKNKGNVAWKFAAL